MDEVNGGQNPIGFERMRAMLARAADLRADEQRQVVDLIDEVRGRLSPLEGFAADGQGRIAATSENVAAINRRLGELPDRGELGTIGERLAEALARIEAQDTVLAQVTAAMAALSERVGAPLAALEARLEGVAGRFEGVSGRLDGLDDRLAHLHSRLDELDSAIERVQGGVDGLPGLLDPASVHRRFDELTGTVNQRFDGDFAGVHARLDDLARRPAVDPTERFDGLGAKLDQFAERLDTVAARVKSVDESVRHNAGTLSGSFEQGMDKLHGMVGARPDRDEVARTLQRAQQESERRITGQLDGALADFAEVMLAQSFAPKATASRSGGRKGGKKAAAGDDDGE